MRLDKPQLLAKFEISGFSYYGNIKKFVCKRRIRFFELPFGGVRDTVYGNRLYLVRKRVVDFLFAITELFC